VSACRLRYLDQDGAQTVFFAEDDMIHFKSVSWTNDDGRPHVQIIVHVYPIAGGDTPAAAHTPAAQSTVTHEANAAASAAATPAAPAAPTALVAPTAAALPPAATTAAAAATPAALPASLNLAALGAASDPAADATAAPTPVFPTALAAPAPALIAAAPAAELATNIPMAAASALAAATSAPSAASVAAAAPAAQPPSVSTAPESTHAAAGASECHYHGGEAEAPLETDRSSSTSNGGQADGAAAAAVKARTQWSDEEIATLARFCKGKRMFLVDWVSVTRELGRSAEASRSKWLRVREEWEDEEGEGEAEADGQVHSVADGQKPARKPKRPWTEAESARVTRDRASGIDWADIGKALGRTSGAIRARHSDLTRRASKAERRQRTPDAPPSPPAAASSHQILAEAAGAVESGAADQQGVQFSFEAQSCERRQEQREAAESIRHEQRKEARAAARESMKLARARGRRMAEPFADDAPGGQETAAFYPHMSGSQSERALPDLCGPATAAPSTALAMASQASQAELSAEGALRLCQGVQKEAVGQTAGDGGGTHGPSAMIATAATSWEGGWTDRVGCIPVYGGLAGR
jgi:hypothetical protein